MLTVISPAKTLDFESAATTTKNSRPGFPKQTKQLLEVMRGKSAKDLSKLMGISPKLAELNVERFQQYKTDSSANGKDAKQALLAFKGDVYIGLEAESYGERDFTFAQKHLRILSGFYGLLKPLDLIQPYRLEMGIKLKTKTSTTLYDFWGDQIAEAISRQLVDHRNKSLINLASIEYFKSVNTKLLPGRLVTPTFKDYSNGTYRVLSFFAKKARGAMATYIVKNRISKPDDIKDFDVDGYRFNKSFSTENKWVFTRKAS